jgi:cyclic pyranopterin phosphate synthase
MGGCDFLQRKEILTLEEVHRIVQLFVECGIRKVRLTGGEPLLRRNIVYLVEKLAAINGIEELALTTNGVFLQTMAGDLKNAGLQRVNISIDALENKSYRDITGFDLLPEVTKGIHKALKMGLSPVKINSVIIKGINVSQILPLAKMSVRLPVAVRFIEYCPTSSYTKPAGDYIPTSMVREIIENKFGPMSLVVGGATDGPALNFKIKNAVGTLGFISGRSSILCHSCNRLRLTSGGTIKPCLYSSQSYDIKKLLRTGADDEQVLILLKAILSEKSNHTKLTSDAGEFHMQKIGG